MKTKDYLFSVLAGFIVIALWYGQLFLSWFGFDTMMLTYTYPIISAVVLFLLMISKNMKQLFLKLGLFLLSVFLFSLLAIQLNLPYILLNIAIPDYGRVSAGGGFAMIVVAILHLIYSGIAILLSLLIHFAFYLHKKRK